jgi:phosphoribosylformylglycinamidine (FGAM) synthase PurS component
MTVRLEIGWRPELSDAEGEGLRRKAQEYCGLALDRVQVLRLLMLDLELSPAELEAIRTEVFTNPVTQVSSFTPLAREFDWALWVGFRPGVRDNAGATAREAIEAFLGRALPREAAVYTSKLYLMHAPLLNRDECARLAQELLANDLIQEFRLFSRADWDPDQGVGLIVPRVTLSHQPNVAVFPIDSLQTLRRLSSERHLYLRDQDLPIIRAYFQRPEVLARRTEIGLGPPTDVERPLQPQHLPGPFCLPGCSHRGDLPPR